MLPSAPRMLTLMNGSSRHRELSNPTYKHREDVRGGIHYSFHSHNKHDRKLLAALTFSTKTRITVAETSPCLKAHSGQSGTTGCILAALSASSSERCPRELTASAARAFDTGPDTACPFDTAKRAFRFPAPLPGQAVVQPPQQALIFQSESRRRSPALSVAKEEYSINAGRIICSNGATPRAASHDAQCAPAELSDALRQLVFACSSSAPTAAELVGAPSDSRSGSDRERSTDAEAVAAASALPLEAARSSSPATTIITPPDQLTYQLLVLLGSA